MAASFSPASKQSDAQALPPGPPVTSLGSHFLRQLVTLTQSGSAPQASDCAQHVFWMQASQTADPLVNPPHVMPPPHHPPPGPPPVVVLADVEVTLDVAVVDD